MGRTNRGMVFLALIGILVASPVVRAANLDLTWFVGTWRNIEPSAGGIATIIITDNGGMQVQVFSACSADLCDWGVVDATAYGRSASSMRANAFLATFDTDDGQSFVTGSRTGRYLRVDVFTKFKEGSGRSDVAWAGVFAKE